MYVHIAIYGTGTVKVKRDQFHDKRTTRQLEDIVGNAKGFQLLHADKNRTYEKFREMFDYHLYDRICDKYNCKLAFPELYDKVNRKVRD